jgi:hypothetical protein
MLLSGRELRPAVEISFNTTQKQTQVLVNAVLVQVESATKAAQALLRFPDYTSK